ncbi:MAG: hypothetical protein V2A65_03095 [Candidatus Omnitrophota bacterium]
MAVTKKISTLKGREGVTINLDSEKGLLVFRNSFILREFKLSPSFGTVRYQYAVSGNSLVDAACPSREAVLKIDGKTVSLDGSSGADFRYHSYTFEQIEDGSSVLHVWLCGNGDFAEKGLRLGLHYQLYPEREYLIKWITLHKEKSGEFVLQEVFPEVLNMPMPSGVLRMVQPMSLHRYAKWRTAASRERFRYCDKNFQTSCDTPTFFLDRQPGPLATGFSFVTDYVNIVEGLQYEEGGVGGIGGSILETRGAEALQEVIVKYGIGPDVVVTAAMPFESFKTYELFFRGGFEDGSLAFKRMLRNLCPWINRNYLTVFLNKDLSFEECQKNIKAAGEAGFELWVPGVRTIFERHDGNLEINKKLFPKGMEQVKALADYAHSLGMKITVYLGHEWALWDMKESEPINRNGWQLRRNDGLPFLDSDNPTAACLASGYEEHILTKILKFLEGSGFDGVDPDGPYDGWLCYDTTHHHRSPGHSQYLQWEAQKKFYRTLRKLGYWIDAPASLSSLFHGNGPIPVGAESWRVGGAYEAGHQTQGIIRLYSEWEEVLTVRQDLWYASFIFPPTVMRHSLSTWSDLENRPEEMLDHWIATLLGYGVQATFRGDVNEKNAPAFKKWADFFKRYRAILESDFVHLLYPDGNHIDAIMHVNSEVAPPGFLMIYNPTPLFLRQSIVIPAAGLEAGKKIICTGKDGRVRHIDVEKGKIPSGIIEGNLAPDCPVAVLNVELTPREIAWYEVAPVK